MQADMAFSKLSSIQDKGGREMIMIEEIKVERRVHCIAGMIHERKGICLKIVERDDGEMISEAVIHGGGSNWENSDTMRRMSDGVILFDEAPEKRNAVVQSITCTRIMKERVVHYVGGFGEGFDHAKKIGLLWDIPTSVLGAHIVIADMLEFTREKVKENEIRTLHILLERDDTSGMNSYGTEVANRDGRTIMTETSKKTAVLIDVCMNEEIADIFLRLTTAIRDGIHRRRLRCESCYVRSETYDEGIHAGTRHRGVEGVWLAIGVSSSSSAVPPGLAGTNPSHWIGHRRLRDREIRLDFEDQSSISIPDLFAWRTSACALSIHHRRKEKKPHEKFMLLASTYPQSHIGT
jgi:hypothetical protein